MRAHRLLITLVLCCLVALPLLAQAPGTHTVLVLPFDNLSHQPGLSWIGEAFPELLGQRLKAGGLYVISRDDRQYAFDRMGIPVNLHASRATLYRVALELDADYIVLGGYSFDGDKFTARAEVLDMKALRLSADLTESGQLNQLISLQTALAWDVLRQVNPQFSEPREAFVHSAPAIRVTAFENFIRGVVATSADERIRYMKAALAIDPNYAQATMLLAKTLFQQRDYTQAAQWFSKIPDTDEATGEANFYLGLSEYQLAHFERASAAFQKTAERVPLTEVLNNAGAAESRRGHRSAVEFFQKAVEADPADEDYHFNLALALYKKGDVTGAQRQLREALARNPNDGEARQLQDAISSTMQPGAALGKPVNMPLPRIKRNYDESSYRQLALEVKNAIEESIGKAKPSRQAELYLERARSFLASGAAGEAEGQFREVLKRQPNSPAALSGLAHALLLEGKYAEARKHARAAIAAEPSSEAYLVLSRADLKDRNQTSARSNLAKALELDPTDEDAKALEKELGQE